ncbi:MAG: MG2 domain-containing protein [Granulosicoccus sp.]
MINITRLLAFTFLLFSSGSVNAAPDELTVQRVTPQGNNVPAGQQITIEFNQPAVPLGEMRRDADELPVSIEPALNCQWRWMDTRTLACQLDAEDRLSQATSYSIAIAPGITTESGAGMKDTYQRTFTTERPDLTDAWFYTWLSPGTPVLFAEFTMPVSRKSVGEHVFFEVRGKRYAIKVKHPSELTDEPDDPGITQINQQVWAISIEQPLPLDSEVQLMTEPGLVSDTGPLLGNTRQANIEFNTFPEFKFLGLNCYSMQTDESLLIAKSSDFPACDPQESVALVFSSPVSSQIIKEYVLIEPDLAGGRKDYDPWDGVENYSMLDQPHHKNQTYEVYLPEALKAFKPYKFTGKKIVDEFGRILENSIDLKMHTAHRAPNLELNQPYSVLEKDIDSQIPAFVTNLDELQLAFIKTLTVDGPKKLPTRAIPLPEAEDVAFAYPLPIRELLNNKSGVVSASLQMKPNPSDQMTSELFVAVTPWQLHVKLGHFKSLAWVVDMATGEPIADAQVSIYIASLDNPAIEKGAVKHNAKTNKQGIAEFAGLQELDPESTLLDQWEFDDERLMIHVEKDQDIAVLPISDAFTVWGQDVYPWIRDQYGYIHAWGTTAQGVYRPGNTIQYKLYVRDQNNQTLIKAPDTIWSLKVIDPVDKVIEEIKGLTLNEFGAFDGELPIPASAAVGWYRFVLRAESPDGENTLFESEPISVLVSEFTPAPFKVQTELNGGRFKPGDELLVTTSARLHAGGPYTGARTTVSADLIAGYFQSEHPIAKDFEFDSWQPESPEAITLFQQQKELDDKGDLKTTYTLNDTDIIYGTVRVESSVQDDRGKSVSQMSRADYFARDRLVGLKNTQWVYKQGEQSEVQYLVVDTDGKPVPDTSVSVDIERLETKAARVKSAGNAYLTEYVDEWVSIAVCNGSSNTDPAACQFTPDEPGSYRITATIKDTNGRPHTSRIQSWVVGKGQVVWEQASNNNLPIIPENDNPQVGDTVRYLVKNPYPGGKALITIERYGILKSWVEDFSDSTEIVEFDIEPDFLPGYYLSINVFSPRVELPPGDGTVDLGKPAFTLGYLSVEVTDPYKQIDVDIISQQETYKPGESVELTFSAKPRNGAATEPVELAVVVLDEAVFDLILEGDAYFDPYAGFYSLASLDVANYNLLTRLIGRQEFERKGANTGGDGGGESDISFRSIEKYIGYWNPSIVLQPGTTESITFKAPDNLTGWRVFAMAVTKDDRLGLGKGSFKVNKEVELRQVMPNQVMQGDQFQAGFSVMNRTDTIREIQIDVVATGSIASDNTISKLVKVEPYKRETIWLPIQSTDPGEIQLTATARSGDATDGLKHTIPVLQRRIFDTAAVYGSFNEGSASTSVLFPKDIREDTGDLSISVSPTVISNVDGAFGYMRDYPYQCWEQRLSKGVMAEYFQSLNDYLPDDLLWKESKALPDTMLTDAASFQGSNGGMGFWIGDDEFVSPYLSAYTALAFGWLKDTGHTIPIDVEKNLHGYLQDMLKRNVMPTFYDKGMAATVRAVALAALAAQGKLQASDIERFRRHVPKMSLFGKAHYLLAASKVGGMEETVSDVTDMILAKGAQSAGKFQFNENLSSDYQRLLATPMRTQCAILSALSETAKTPAGKSLVEDTPFKIVRAITQGRGARDHWENTQENLFCMNALREYSGVYESEDAAMSVTATMDNKVLGTSAFSGKQDPDMVFIHAINSQDPGRKTTVSIEKEGQGRLYYTTRLRYAKKDTAAEPVHSGMQIRREFSVNRGSEWVMLQSPIQIKRGELVRVDLFVDLPASRNYVVIDDPVPGGLEPVNRDLATTSVMDAEAGDYEAAAGSFWFDHDDWNNFGYSRNSFYHQELRHDSVRFFADFLNPGHYHLSYIAQAIATGTFTVLPAKSEEMYDPDVYGRTPPASLEVSD